MVLRRAVALALPLIVTFFWATVVTRAPVLAQDEPVACSAPRVIERPISTFAPDDEGGDTGRIRSVALATSYADMSDRGNGSFRLCLDGERSVKGQAWCDWTEDRSAVLSVRTGDFRAAGRRLSLYLMAATSVGDPADPHQLSIRPRSGGSWGTDDGSIAVATTQTGEPLVTFEAPWHGTRDRPALRGILAIRCGEPPKLEPGRSLGRVTFRTSDDPDRVFETAAICEWAIWDLASTVVRVSNTTTRARTADGGYVSLVIDLAEGSTPSVQVRVARTPPLDWSDWGVIDWRYAFPLWTSSDLRSGTVRAHRLTDAETHFNDLPTSFDAPSSEVLATWECGEAPRRVDSRIDWRRHLGEPGLVTLHLPGMAPAGQVSPASCVAVDEEEDGTIHVWSVAAPFRYGRWDALLVARKTGFVGLYLRSQDGSFAGSLTSGPQADDEVWDGDGQGRVEVNDIPLERSVLSPDATIPATLDLNMTWDCQPGLGALD
ncbi:MAG: hypothetical protein ABWZ82_07115 [Candidatus Limnocylindrales bacterium]